MAHNDEPARAPNMSSVLACETPGESKRLARRIEKETGLKVLPFPKDHEFCVGLWVVA